MREHCATGAWWGVGAGGGGGGEGERRRGYHMNAFTRYSSRHNVGRHLRTKGIVHHGGVCVCGMKADGGAASPSDMQALKSGEKDGVGRTTK